ncbi:MAG: hypothetical protein JXA13_03880 [Anaerolineales bacterium]|nr:hypothetical protein [Anaerolineales bacterium]
MKKYSLTKLIIFAIVGTLMAACQPTVNDTQQPAAGQEQQQEAQSPSNASTKAIFDPAMGGNADSAGLVYETLLKIEGEELIPMLALGSTVSDDGLDYIVNLRPGVIFHDGSALNADVVIANFNRWSDGTNGIETWATSFGGYRGEIDENGKPKSIYDGVEKVDELTVLIHLNTPDAEFLNKLAAPTFSIVSVQALAGGNFGSEAGGDGGSGPYMIKTWSDTVLKLDPYTDYWNPNTVPGKGMDLAIGK